VPSQPYEEKKSMDTEKGDLCSDLENKDKENSGLPSIDISSSSESDSDDSDMAFCSSPVVKKVCTL